MLPSNLASSRTTQLRVVLSAIVVMTILLIGVQSALASPPPVQIETTIDNDRKIAGSPIEIDAKISNIENNNDKNVKITKYSLYKGVNKRLQQSEDVGVIAPGGSLSIPLSVTFDNPGQKELELEVTVSKRGDAGEYTYKKPIYIEVSDSDLRGDVKLTSTSVTGSDAVRIEGDAANIGGTDVESVLLSVPNTDSVSPTPPNGEYYVGGIETSEFGTFELTADIANNTDSIPVDITYITTGGGREDMRVTKTQQISVEEQPSTAPQPRQAQATTAGASSSGGGPPIVIIGGVAALVVFSAIGLVLWRR